MASLINTVLGDGLQLLAQEAEAQRATILAAAAAANVQIEQAVDLFINSLKVGGALAIVLPSIKPSLISAINNAIAANATTEEGALFDLLVAAAQNEAKVLLAH